MPTQQKKKPPPKKPGGGGDKKPKKPDLRKRARRDVNVAMQPQRDLLARQRTQAIREGGQRQDALRSLYGGLQQSLQGLIGPEQHQYSAIGDNLNDQLKGLMGNLGGSSSPAGELAAAGGLFGNLGAASLGAISSDAARDLSYDNSVKRQGLEEGVVASRNARQDVFNELSDLRQQQQQLTAGFQPEFLSHLGDLRDQNQQYSLALKEYQLRALQEQHQQDQNDAIYQYLMGTIGNSPFGDHHDPFHNPPGNQNQPPGGHPGPGNGNPGGNPNDHGGWHDPPGMPGGGGGGPGSAFDQFVSGQRGWGAIEDPGHTAIRNRIEGYFHNNGDDPAFAALRRQQQGPYSPMQIIESLRDFYYRPHHPGGPGGKPIP